MMLRRIGDLRRMHILLDLLHTQGINAATAFLDRAEEDGRTGERATNRFVAKPAVHNFRIAAKDIDELHPKKPKHVVELVQQIHELLKVKSLCSQNIEIRLNTWFQF